MKITNYNDLKAFCNSLTEEQLQQEAYFTIVDGAATKIESAHVQDVDRYFDHCDEIGTLEEIKNENPEDWQDVIADATVVPKGTVFLCNE